MQGPDDDGDGSDVDGGDSDDDFGEVLVMLVMIMMLIVDGGNSISMFWGLGFVFNILIQRLKHLHLKGRD